MGSDFLQLAWLSIRVGFKLLPIHQMDRCGWLLFWPNQLISTIWILHCLTLLLIILGLPAASDIIFTHSSGRSIGQTISHIFLVFITDRGINIDQGAISLMGSFNCSWIQPSHTLIRSNSNQHSIISSWSVYCVGIWWQWNQQGRRRLEMPSLSRPVSLFYVHGDFNGAWNQNSESVIICTINVIVYQCFLMINYRHRDSAWANFKVDGDLSLDQFRNYFTGSGAPSITLDETSTSTIGICDRGSESQPAPF